MYTLFTGIVRRDWKAYKRRCCPSVDFILCLQPSDHLFPEAHNPSRSQDLSQACSIQLTLSYLQQSSSHPSPWLNASRTNRLASSTSTLRSPSSTRTALPTSSTHILARESGTRTCNSPCKTSPIKATMTRKPSRSAMNLGQTLPSSATTLRTFGVND